MFPLARSAVTSHQQLPSAVTDKYCVPLRNYVEHDCVLRTQSYRSPILNVIGSKLTENRKLCVHFQN